MEVLQCSAPAENKGNLACFVEVLAPNLVDVGMVLADNGSGFGTAPACPPLPLCSRDGRRVLLRMHQHSSRHRHEDGGEGDDRSIAHGHGLSSDDHDDAGVDSDLPLAGRGNNGRPRTESASGDPVAGIAPSTSSQRALQTVLDWSPRLSYTVNRREASPGNVICEGETHGFEKT